MCEIIGTMGEKTEDEMKALVIKNEPEEDLQFVEKYTLDQFSGRYLGYKKNSKRHGYGKSFDPQTLKIQYEGHFKNDLFHGLGRYTDEEEVVSYGFRLNGKKHGFGFVT